MTPSYLFLLSPGILALIRFPPPAGNSSDERKKVEYGPSMESLSSVLFALLTTPLPPIFYDAAAIVIVALLAWRGWKRGVLRELSGAISIAAAYLLAHPLGKLIQTFLPLSHIPLFLHSAAAASVGGIVAYIVFRIGASILVRLTGSGRVEGAAYEIMSGAGGVVGAAFGALIVFLIGLYIVVIGSFRMPASISDENKAGTPKMIFLPPMSASAHREPFLNSYTGKIMEKINPANHAGFTNSNLFKSIPGSEAAGNITKNIKAVTKIMQEPEKVRSVIESEELRGLMQNDSVQSLSKNPEIMKMVKDGDIIGLMGNPDVIKAMNDPKIMQSLKGIDINKLLDQSGATAN